MEYQIKQISCYAENILEQLAAGTVHSVYRRTINLTDGRRLLSLQTDHSPLSPISLISGLTAHDFGLLSVKPGDAVCFSKDGFLLPGMEGTSRPSYRFTFAGSQRYDLRLSKPLTDRIRLALAANIQEAVSKAETDGFTLLFNDQASRPLVSGAKVPQETNTDGSLTLVLLAARNYILRCNELMHDRRYQEAALELLRLLGLGCGLTPSGDDFLCGVLAGILFSGSTDHPFAKQVKTLVAKRLFHTIDISAAFLSCALDGQFSLPVVSLYKLPSPEEILASFSAVGHSSGIDTLCGILWSLDHIV